VATMEELGDATNLDRKSGVARWEMSGSPRGLWTNCIGISTAQLSSHKCGTLHAF
jgi:hypothetical protein